MGEDTVDTNRRVRLRHDLTRETRRLMQHINHLSVEEVKVLEGVVEDLRKIHNSDKECANLARRHSDRPPPWGTKYANPIERAFLTVFRDRR